MTRLSRLRVDISEMKYPRKYERNGEARGEQHDDESHRSVGEIEAWGDVVDDLQDDPCDDGVSCRNPVDVAAFQFGEETAHLAASLALEIVAGGGMTEVGPAAGLPIFDESRLAQVLLEPLRVTQRRVYRKPY